MPELNDTSAWIISLIALIPCYLIGAFPTGKLISLLHGVQIEQMGSGNVGATNIARVLGKKAGLITLMIDLAKGMLALIFGKALALQAGFHAVAGLFAVLGHCFSIPGRSKGGKGVATSLGVLILLNPGIALLCLLIFGVVLRATKFVSLSSVCATLSAPLFLLFTNADGSVLSSVCLMALVVTYKHFPNLKRLSEGNEPKIKFRQAPTLQEQSKK